METQNRTCNRVYINPNFHGPRPAVAAPNNKVHINPLFGHENKTKEIPCHSQTIYVNPNFVNTHSMSSFHNTGLMENFKDVNNAPIVKTKTGGNDNTIAKSKYSIVRRQTSTKTATPNMSRNLMKINRYKIAPITVAVTKTIEDKKCTKPTRYSYLQDNSIKNITNHLKSTSKYKIFKRKRQTSTVLTENALSCSGYSEKKCNKKIYSKNYIPCPLFKKYGKCIRHEKGNCKFVHDKKHVSVCRKFLQGMCQNKDCIFSHEITTKKMPTCHFYLQGICTKTDCPYLHVKLSEYTNICNDFQKGYCERGEQCMKRHIESSCNLSRKKFRNSFKTCKSTTKRVKRSTSKITDSKNTETTEDKAKRYYKTNGHNKSVVDDSCKVIKPSRCKLGDLPSFISL